ncbi:MAG: UDP-N-acetylmuramoyl-L-alanine--D-glutamate ligase [Alphaproteobacteria bacterium]|nr:UDP-N-acetylmuramoyl-L-alanine--D-glutamate ligase [Alphaproteobacteria bacterium]
MKAAIIGLGKSGIAARRILSARDGVTDFTLFDDNGERPVSEFTDTFDITVISPGIPPAKIINRPKKFTSEIELGLNNLPDGARVIAITGTDGKSTTTTLTAQILKEAGHPAVACGNFGYPLADAVLDHGAGTIFVVELSSYQLDLLPAHPYFDAACILNIAPDHLDRYGTFENYAASKYRIKQMLKPGAKFFDADNIPRKKYDNFQLPGAHNALNLDFAVALAQSVINKEITLSSIIPNLTGLEHRMEYVPTTDGIHWYNDSKATAIQPVQTALKSFDNRVILLMGGRDKHIDFTPLADDINARCDFLILFGESAKKIHAQLSGGVKIPIIMAANLKDAVNKARESATPGNHILLSPGCTSWDEFKNFEERGNEFKNYVKNHKS